MPNYKLSLDISNKIHTVDLDFFFKKHKMYRKVDRNVESDSGEFPHYLAKYACAAPKLRKVKAKASYGSEVLI